MPMTRTSCCAAAAAFVLAALSSSAQAQWQWVNPLPTGSPITALTWDGSQFFGFDSSGTVLSSPDGFSWTTMPSGRFEAVTAIVHGPGLYVAAGSAFGGVILTSPDGLTWTSQAFGVPVQRFGQALWNPDLGQFALVADSGVILTSNNGTDWTPQASGTVNDLADIIWSNGEYVVVGANGTILTSSNGTDWTDRSLAGSDFPLISVAANGSLFAIVQGGFGLGQSTILTNKRLSKPGDWKTAFSVVDPSTRSQLTRVVWDGTAFVAIGGTVAVSTDGSVWTQVASGVANILDAVAVGDGEVVAADDSGDLTVTPLGGLAWTPASSNIVADNLTGVIWSGSEFDAVSDVGSFLSSTDGVNWQVDNFALPLAANALAAGAGTLVAVGDGGIASSPDGGFTWYPSATAGLGGVTFYGVTWGDDQFVAVGSITVPTPPLFSLQQGVIYTSTDGTNWTARESNAVLGDSIHAVLWAGDRFIAVGASSSHDVFGDLVLGPPTVFTSPDGAAWTRTTPLTGAVAGGTALLGIAWNGKQFVAVGSPGFNFDSRSVATSADGSSWQYVFPLPDAVGATSGALRSVIWTGAKFVAIGELSSELDSPDGHTWTAHATGANGLIAVAASGTQCVAVGDTGSIMRETSVCNADAVFANGFE